MPSNNVPTVPTRTATNRAQAVIGVVLLAAVAYVGYRALRPTPSAEKQQAADLVAGANVSVSTGAGDTFSDLFDAAYRPDEGVGNIAIAATYYYPALQQALDRYTQQSAHQEEAAQVLAEQGANDTALAFYLIVDSVVTQAGIDFSRGVTLQDSAGRTYAFRSWEDLRTSPSQAPGQVRTASLLFFNAQSETGVTYDPAGSDVLTLTVSDVGGVATRTFRWDPRLLPAS